MFSAILMVAVSGGVEAPALGGELKSKISNIGGNLNMRERLSGLRGKLGNGCDKCEEVTTTKAAGGKTQAAGKGQYAGKGQAAGKGQSAGKGQDAGKGQAPKAQSAGKVKG